VLFHGRATVLQVIFKETPSYEYQSLHSAMQSLLLFLIPRSAKLQYRKCWDTYFE
jgi:hypothetical protein